ncbi:hypothetical protein CERSUDRAFT_127530 [Gelatoporia subvermispora B]|uniref:DUF6534 domain-containing protein n=1 Tax=Ceriporiopsis subvermispora (strain B) TaxID=914234 RepID=M2QXH6_CERS8|nr:hypothetical protein CERSUDRAFT_127530 [Gelatoporia subvermispora B]
MRDNSGIAVGQISSGVQHLNNAALRNAGGCRDHSAPFFEIQSPNFNSSQISMGLMVQCFFGLRVYRTSEGNIFIPVIIVILALAQFSRLLLVTRSASYSPACPLALGIFYAFEISKSHLEITLAKVSWSPIAGIGCSMANDFVISASLCYYLRKIRSGMLKTDRLINVIVMYTVNTGVLTSMVSTCAIILTTVFPKTLWLSVPFCLISKCYVNSVLATLNAREKLRHMNSGLTLNPSLLERSDLQSPRSSTIIVRGHPFDRTPGTKSSMHVQAEIGSNPHCGIYPRLGTHRVYGSLTALLDVENLLHSLQSLTPPPVRYEPKEPLVHLAILVVPPVLLSAFTSHDGSLLWIWVTSLVYWAILASSITIYHLSPFHPLARYPGPLLHKVTRVAFTRVALGGSSHMHIDQLHGRYGDIVRVGPNALSIRDPSAIPDHGFPSTAYQARGLYPRIMSLISMSGDDHSAMRKLWNRGFTSTALKDYEQIVAGFVEELVDVVGKKTGSFDLGTYFSWFTFDVISRIAFGEGSHMLADGDIEGVWSIMQDSQEAGQFFSYMPWLAINSAIIAQIAQIGVWSEDRYTRISFITSSVNNEDGSGKRGRPLSHVVNDGILAILAGSDTTANALTNLFYLLLANPAEYKRLQVEIDKYYPLGENALDTEHHQNMPILNAVINEALRLLPVVPGGSQRVCPPGGKVVGSYYIPESTFTIIPTYSMNRDPRNFAPYTTSFWPDRWLIATGEMTPQEAGIDESTFVYNSNAFIPFSFGPSNCVGKNLALQEMRMVVCHTLQRLELRFAPGYDVDSYESKLKDYFVIKRAELSVEVTPRSRCSL